MGFPSFDLGLTTGGAAPTLRPRQWQSRLIQLLRARLLNPEPGGHDVLIHAGPGAGKTLGALLSFQAMQREGRIGHFVVFCHRSSIARQWLAAAARLNLQLVEWDPEQGPPTQSKPTPLVMMGRLVRYPRPYGSDGF